MLTTTFWAQKQFPTQADKQDKKHEAQARLFEELITYSVLGLYVNVPRVKVVTDAQHIPSLFIEIPAKMTLGHYLENTAIEDIPGEMKFNLGKLAAISNLLLNQKSLGAENVLISDDGMVYKIDPLDVMNEVPKELEKLLIDKDYKLGLVSATVLSDETATLINNLKKQFTNAKYALTEKDWEAFLLKFTKNKPISTMNLIDNNFADMISNIESFEFAGKLKNFNIFRSTPTPQEVIGGIISLMPIDFYDGKKIRALYNQISCSNGYNELFAVLSILTKQNWWLSHNRSRKTIKEFADAIFLLLNELNYANHVALFRKIFLMPTKNKKINDLLSKANKDYDYFLSTNDDNIIDLIHFQATMQSMLIIQYEKLFLETKKSNNQDDKKLIINALNALKGKITLNANKQSSLRLFSASALQKDGERSIEISCAS